jgi:hypothetical protein
MIVKVELDELPVAAAHRYKGRVPQSVLVKAKLPALLIHDMTLRLRTSAPSSKIGLAEVASQKIPYIVVTGADMLTRFCRALAVDDEPDCTIRDLELQIVFHNPGGHETEILTRRQEALLRPIRRWLWGFPAVALANCRGIDHMQLASQIWGGRWKTGQEFLREVLSLVHVDAPRCIERGDFERALDLCIEEAQSIVLATTMTEFGINLEYDQHFRAQYPRLDFSVYYTATRAGSKLINQILDTIEQSSDVACKAREWLRLMAFSNLTIVKVEAALKRVDSCRMSSKQLAKVKAELYIYQCEALTVTDQLGPAHKALTASIKADVRAGSQTQKRQEWHIMRKRISNVRNDMSHWSSRLTSKVVKDLMKRTAAMALWRLQEVIAAVVYTLRDESSDRPLSPWSFWKEPENTMC